MDAFQLAIEHASYDDVNNKTYKKDSVLHLAIQATGMLVFNINKPLLHEP